MTDGPQQLTALVRVPNSDGPVLGGRNQASPVLEKVELPEKSPGKEPSFTKPPWAWIPLPVREVSAFDIAGWFGLNAGWATHYQETRQGYGGTGHQGKRHL